MHFGRARLANPPLKPFCMSIVTSSTSTFDPLGYRSKSALLDAVEEVVEM